MTITPQDIQSKQFHVRLRGFDVDEVDKFLEKVAEEFLILSLEHKQAMERICAMEKEIANFRNKEQAFQSAILSAQRISDEMQGKSRRESEETLQRANEEAAELEASSRTEAEAVLARATQEAEAMRARATAQARSLVENSSSRMLELTGEINLLITMKTRIIGDLRRMLEGYLDRLGKGVPAGLEDLEPLPEPQALDLFPASEVDVQPEPTATTPDDDLENLYEKIDLPDVGLDNHPDAAEEEAMATLELADIEALELDGDRGHQDIAIAQDQDLNLASDITIPDLGDDLLFSLEDPLDELEPSISIRDDNKNG